MCLQRGRFSQHSSHPVRPVAVEQRGTSSTHTSPWILAHCKYSVILSFLNPCGEKKNILKLLILGRETTEPKSFNKWWLETFFQHLIMFGTSFFSISLSKHYKKESKTNALGSRIDSFVFKKMQAQRPLTCVKYLYQIFCSLNFSVILSRWHQGLQ